MSIYTEYRIETEYVVRRSETGRAPYKDVGVFSDLETAQAEYRNLCYRDLACDPHIETRDIEKRLPYLSRYTQSSSFQYPYGSGPKTRLFRRKKKIKIGP